MSSSEAISQRLARRRQEGTGGRSMATPRRLRALSTLIATAAIGMTIIGAGAMVAAGATAIVVQQRTVPSILGMQRLHALLSDADRGAANAYLAGGSEVTLPELQFQADVGSASRELSAASERNPGGQDASQRLQTISGQLDQYLELVQTASVDDRQGQTVGTVYLQAATVLMHRPGSGILAEVDSLRGLYAGELDSANRTLEILAGVVAVYALIAVGGLGLLLYTQGFVRRRFRRRRSPRLLAATLLLLIAAGTMGVGAVRAGQSIHSAETESYARALNLWTARALLDDANGSETLSLIARDANARGQYDQAFLAQTSQLVDVPLNDQLVADASHGVVGFNGKLADELRAAKPGAERAAAMQVLTAYRRFMDADARVRALVNGNRAQDAVLLALGTDEGQLTFAWADVDWYLGVAVSALQSQFDSTLTGAEQVLGATAAVEVLALLAAWLTVGGLRPRIDEFLAPRRG